MDGRLVAKILILFAIFIGILSLVQNMLFPLFYSMGKFHRVKHQKKEKGAYESC